MTKPTVDFGFPLSSAWVRKSLITSGGMSFTAAMMPKGNEQIIEITEDWDKVRDEVYGGKSVGSYHCGNRLGIPRNARVPRR